MNLRLVLLGLTAIGAFLAGWQTNGWRLEEKYARQDLAREAAVRAAMAMNARHVSDVNAASADREMELLAQLDVEREHARELRNEIDHQPLVRQVVRVPVAGECPAVPTVDWRVFRDLYNRAATGEAATADRGDAAVPGAAAGVAGGSGAGVADRP